MAYRTTNVNPTVLRVVRVAMLTMLLLFVGLASYLHQGNPPQLSPETDLGAIRLVGFAMCVGMMAGVLVVRTVRQRVAMEKRGTLALVGTAMGEAAALLGAVYYFMGGGLEVFAAGLLVFLSTWALLPADPEAV